MIFVFIRTLAKRCTAVVALVIFVFIRTLAERCTAIITLVILVFVCTFTERCTAVIALVVFIPVGAIVRFDACTAIHRASAGVGTVAV